MKKWMVPLLLLLTCALLFACAPTVPPVAETTAPAEDTPTEAPSDTEAEATTPSEETTAKVDEPAEPSPAVLYQLAPEKNSLMQSYVIKTPNGKLIVIDGGIDGEGLNRDPYMPTALRAIAVLASTIAGAAMGQKMIEESGYWQLALMLGLAIVGSLMAWRIQAGMACLHRRRQ